MRKDLKEIIENLKDVSASMRASGSLENSENANRIVQQIGRLSALTKPEQYVVEIEKFYYLGDLKCCSWNIFNQPSYFYSINEAKEGALETLNIAAKYFALPPITIYQITFIEPEA